MIEIIKQASMDAVEASKPLGVCFGTVVSESPLRINIEQKITLEQEHLLLTSMVSEFDVDMSVEHFTEVGSLHSHEYKGKKSFKIHLALKTGEAVILLRLLGGQKYIVLDRVR